jgi:hypothetical protein
MSVLRSRSGKDRGARRAPRPRQALLFLCHNDEPAWIKRFRSLRRGFRPWGDAFFAFHLRDGAGVPSSLRGEPSFVFSDGSVDALGYRRIREGLVPGSTHFPLMQFAREHPEYDFYWVVEYDVRLTAPWRLFFSDIARSDADVIGSHVATPAQHPGWYWWSSLEVPEMEPPPPEQLRFFAPVYRLSADAVGLIDAKMRAGWRGHYETLVPTLASAAGLKVMDLAKGGTVPSATPRSWYVHGPSDSEGQMDRGTMRWRNIGDWPVLRLNTLYHPMASWRLLLGTLVNRHLRHWAARSRQRRGLKG